MAMRWFLVGTQYRQPINYSQVALEEASARLYYLTETLVSAKNMINASGTELPFHQYIFLFADVVASPRA